MVFSLEIRHVPSKGRGVFSTRCFSKVIFTLFYPRFRQNHNTVFQGEYVVEYSGDLIDVLEAKSRDEKYSKDTNRYGSYMYYFHHRGTKWCIDATIETGKYGRLLNHSCKTPNCATKVLEVCVHRL